MKVSFTRRHFLKRAALSAGALSGLPLVGPNLLRAAGASNKLNCAHIGCGGRAMSHLEWIVTQSQDNVVAIVDPDEKAQAKVLRYLKEHDRDPAKVQVFTDYRRMFDEIGKQLDAVIIATPNHHHAPASMVAMELNKGVYCEKPLTHDIS